MKLGMMLISHVYKPERAAIVDKSLSSLGRTKVPDGMERPRMLLSNTTSDFHYRPYISEMRKKWDVDVVTDLYAAGSDVQRFNNIQLNGMKELLADSTDLTHIYFMYDDFVYNSDWMVQLKGVIDRHPGARAWSVYRSSYISFHRIIGGDKTDVLMTMHDGTGCMTVQEWNEYMAQANNNFGIPGLGAVCTMDVHHSYLRPGDRWATKRDYIQNIGVHEFLGRMDQAIDFVGED